MSLSTERDFEDFLRRLSPVRVALERGPIPLKQRREQAYDLATDELRLALRSGSRVRLEAAVFALEVAS